MAEVPVQLSRFRNDWYTSGRSKGIEAAWFFIGLPVLRSALLPSSALRRWLLRRFGAVIGRGVVIKPGVRVKYPWKLTVGNDSWIGEDVWIDNLAPVTIGHDACVSQGVYFCTGNHDWSDPAFGLIVRSIRIGNGAWAGAKSVLAPGVEVGDCAIVAAGSVVTKSVPAGEIHAGNPAVFVRTREFQRDKSSIEYHGIGIGR